jgi:enamine deaminase RidA (YjgF/YER057c/UK114 family)
MRQQIGSGSPWEDIVGYSRAVKVGNIIEVAGTTAMDGEILVGKDDVYVQTKFIFKKIENALQQLGSSLNDVVRTRMFVTNIDDWELIGKAHGEFFATIKPVATMVEVSKLINDTLLIEIEVTAITSSSPHFRNMNCKI